MVRKNRSQITPVENLVKNMGKAYLAFEAEQTAAYNARAKAEPANAENIAENLKIELAFYKTRMDQMCRRWLNYCVADMEALDKAATKAKPDATLAKA